MRSDNTQLLWKGDEHPPLDLLREYQEQALPKPESLAVERHLVSCELCTDLVQGMTLSDRTTTRKAVNDLNAQLRNMASRKRKRRLPLIPLLDWRAAASILVLLCSVGLMVFYMYDQIKRERLATARKAEIAAEAELYAISPATDTLLIAVPGYKISAAPATTPAAPAEANQQAAAANPETGIAKRKAATDKPLPGAAGMVAGATVQEKANRGILDVEKRTIGKINIEDLKEVDPTTISPSVSPRRRQTQEFTEPALPDSRRQQKGLAETTKNNVLKNPTQVDSVLEQSASKVLQGRLAGVAVEDKTKVLLPDARRQQSVKAERAAAPTVVRSTHESMGAELTTAGKQLKGQVLSEEGEPLPGVTVVVKGTGTGTSTDLQGNFVLTTPTDNPTLAFNYIGYKVEEVKVDTRTPSVKVELSLDRRSLDEVVVIGYGARKETAAAVQTVKPAPVTGTKAYKKYLNQFRHYPASLTPDKVNGRVVVAFKVTAQGNLVDIHIRKKLHPALDAEAIRLVNEGPAWKPATAEGKAVEQQVQVSIRFKPE